MIDHLNRVVSDSWSEWMPEAQSEPPPLDWIIHTNGGTAMHDNVILFGLRATDGQPLFVAKVCRLAEFSQTLISEFEALETLWGILDDEAGNIIPRPLALLKEGGDVALVIPFLSGREMSLNSRSSLWIDDARLRSFFGTPARLLRRIHDKSAISGIGIDFEEDDFGVKADVFRSQFELTPDEIHEIEHLADAITALSASAPDKVLLQGDFWHGNMLWNGSSGALKIVDWQFARWSSDVSQDVYLFPLAAALKAVPYGPEKKRALAASRVLLKWQAEEMPAYLQAYGLPQGYGLLPRREGMLACCIEMATRPTLAFGVQHPDDVMWRIIFGELRKWQK